MDNNFSTFTTLQWNGVELQLPEDWEPLRLGRCAFRVAGPDEGGAVLDCSWQRGRAVSVRKGARRLRKGLRDLAPRFGREQLPDSLVPVCDLLEERGLRVQPFAWGESEDNSDPDRGVGFLLRNERSGSSFLLRLLRPEALDGLATEVLNSFRDETADTVKNFRLFGISARVRGDLELRCFSFKPGHYRLEFLGTGRAKGTGLALERLSPASVLLQGEDFPEWVGKRFGRLVDATLEEGHWQGGPCVMWSSGSKRGLWERLFSGRKGAPSMVRAWRPENSNTVLCVALKNRKGATKSMRDIFEEVCAEYGVVQVRKD